MSPKYCREVIIDIENFFTYQYILTSELKKSTVLYVLIWDFKDNPTGVSLLIWKLDKSNKMKTSSEKNP